MRILFLSTWYPFPPDNGSKIRVYHLLRALGNSHQVTLCSFAFDTARPDTTAEMQRLCVGVKTTRRNPFVRSNAAQRLRFFSLAPIVATPLPEMTQAVRGILGQVAYDVVIASTEVMANYAFLADKAAKVLEEHNSLTRWMWERYNEQKTTLQKLRCWTSWQKTRYYEARVLRRFDLCTMVSKQDQATALELPGYKGQVELVPNGVDCAHNHPGLTLPQPNTLVFNGSLTYSANLDAMRYFIAEVFPLIRQQIPETSLTITGATTNVNLSGLLQEGVHFSGYVDDVRPWVAGACVCVAPILQGGGTRLKILEAMALGTPVVATSKGAEGLDIVPGEHLLTADEPKAFAACVLQLFQDKALRRRLIGNARRLVEQQYDWEQIGQRFVNLVEDIIRG